MVSEPEGGTLGEMANLPIKSPVLQTLEKKTMMYIYTQTNNHFKDALVIHVCI